MSNILWLGVAFGVLAVAIYIRTRPPQVVPMSDAWMDHFRYQITKDGVRQGIYYVQE